MSVFSLSKCCAFCRICVRQQGGQGHWKESLLRGIFRWNFRVRMLFESMKAPWIFFYRKKNLLVLALGRLLEEYQSGYEFSLSWLPWSWCLRAGFSAPLCSVLNCFPFLDVNIPHTVAILIVLLLQFLSDICVIFLAFY